MQFIFYNLDKSFRSKKNCAHFKKNCAVCNSNIDYILVLSVHGSRMRLFTRDVVYRILILTSVQILTDIRPETGWTSMYRDDIHIFDRMYIHSHVCILYVGERSGTGTYSYLFGTRKREDKKKF